MTEENMELEIGLLFPGAAIGEMESGEIVIYTGLVLVDGVTEGLER